MHELIKEIERQLEMDRIEEGNMSAEDVLYIVKGFKRPYLNENQQIVLDWLKNDMLDDSDFYNTIYNSRFLYVNGEPHRKENIAFMKLKNKELAQVIQAFSQWAIEQEEE
ncbi:MULTISPECIES: hypothetical protein [Enterococcus]|uniref:hypothetical protein n=1 Tax=Enterococcus TaxID=1350 RepID=UPI000B6FCD91|nr:hypothetical protein [Enterococcus faecalis]OTP17041.1 hypothetical protein A5830_000809 [Enterococcus faecalis]